MHICTVQHIHPCFDKIATILAKRHQRAQRSLRTKHPPYELLEPKCRWWIERIKEFLTVSLTMCPSNKSQSSSTNGWWCCRTYSRHLWISTFACIFYSAVSSSFHWITILTPKSKSMQKGKTITFHLWCSSFLTSVAPKKLHCSGSQSSKKSYIQLKFSLFAFSLDTVRKPY